MRETQSAVCHLMIAGCLEFHEISNLFRKALLIGYYRRLYSYWLYLPLWTATSFNGIYSAALRVFNKICYKVRIMKIDYWNWIYWSNTIYDARFANANKNRLYWISKFNSINASKWILLTLIRSIYVEVKEVNL